MDCKKHSSSNSAFIKVNECSTYRDMGLAPAQRREVPHLHPRCEQLQFVFFAEYSLADDRSIVEPYVMAADEEMQESAGH